jgi:gas vesicle protein
MHDQEYISSSGLITSFLGGVAIGYGIALLFAPRSGRETREMLGDYAQSTGEKISKMARNAADSAKDAAESVGQKASEYGQKAGEYVDKAKSQARSTASEVEQRLKSEKQPSRNQ